MRHIFQSLPLKSYPGSYQDDFQRDVEIFQVKSRQRRIASVVSVVNLLKARILLEVQPENFLLQLLQQDFIRLLHPFHMLRWRPSSPEVFQRHACFSRDSRPLHFELHLIIRRTWHVFVIVQSLYQDSYRIVLMTNSYEFSIGHLDELLVRFALPLRSHIQVLQHSHP